MRGYLIHPRTGGLLDPDTLTFIEEEIGDRCSYEIAKFMPTKH
jgi:hypothetical protein